MNSSAQNHALMTSQAWGIFCSHNLTVNYTDYSVHAHFMFYGIWASMEKRERVNTAVSSEVFSGVYVYTVHHIWVHEAVRHDIFLGI